MDNYIKMDEQHLLDLKKKLQELSHELQKWRARCEYWESMYLGLAQTRQHKDVVDQILNYERAVPDEAE